MNTQVTGVGGVAVAVAIVVAVFMSLMRVDTYVKMKAFADCGNVASFSFEERKTGENGAQIVSKTVEPNHGFYKTCLEDKGYKTKVE